MLVNRVARSLPSLERFANLRAVTVTKAHEGRERCLPALPDSVQALTLDVGRFKAHRCEGEAAPRSGCPPADSCSISAWSPPVDAIPCGRVLAKRASDARLKWPGKGKLGVAGPEATRRSSP